MFGTTPGWTPEVPSYPSPDVLSRSGVQGKFKSPTHSAFRTRILAVRTGQLVENVFVCVRVNRRQPRRPGCPWHAPPPTLGALLAVLGLGVIYASCRPPSTSETASVHPLPAVQRRTYRVSADDQSLPFLVGYVEAACLGHGFHCEASLGHHLGSPSPTLPGGKYKVGTGTRSSSRILDREGEGKKMASLSGANVVGSLKSFGLRFRMTVQIV